VIDIILKYSLPLSLWAYEPLFEASIRFCASRTDPIDSPFGHKLLVASKAGSLNTLGSR